MGTDCTHIQIQRLLGEAFGSNLTGLAKKADLDILDSNSSYSYNRW